MKVILKFPMGQGKYIELEANGSPKEVAEFLKLYATTMVKELKENPMVA